jgi:hypothetical protein
MIELYSKSYSRLIARAKNYSKEEDEDEEPPEKSAPPERQVINLAQESAPQSQNDWSKYFETSQVDEEPKKKVKNDQNSQPVNMMDARTISYKENASKRPHTSAEESKAQSSEVPTSLLGL